MMEITYLACLEAAVVLGRARAIRFGFEVVRRSAKRRGAEPLQPPRICPTDVEGERKFNAYVSRQTRNSHSGGRRFDPDQLHHL